MSIDAVTPLRRRMLSAHPSRQLKQDRHVMTTIATSRSRNARLVRKSAIGHGGAHSNVQRPTAMRSTSVVQRC